MFLACSEKGHLQLFRLEVFKSFSTSKPKSGRSFHHVLQISGTGQRRQTLGNASSLASPNA